MVGGFDSVLRLGPSTPLSTNSGQALKPPVRIRTGLA